MRKIKKTILEMRKTLILRPILMMFAALAAFLLPASITGAGGDEYTITYGHL